MEIIETNHKGEWCTPAERTCQEGFCSECYLARFNKLPPRQKQTLGFVAEGKPNKEIADRMGVNECVIKQYVSNLFTRFGVNNRTQLTVTAIKRGVIKI